MREDATVGTPLLRLTATDRDAGDNGRVQYVLCDHQPWSAANSSKATDVVAVEADTGWLSTAAALDYETVQQVSHRNFEQITHLHGCARVLEGRRSKLMGKGNIKNGDITCQHIDYLAMCY